MTQQTSEYGSPTQTNRPIKHARAFLSLNRSTGRNVNYINSGKSTSASYQKVNATKRQDRHTANVSNMLSNDCHGCDNYKQQYNSAIEKSADKLRSDLLLCCLSLLVPNCQNVIRRQSKKLRGWKLTYSSKAPFDQSPVKCSRSMHQLFQLLQQPPALALAQFLNAGHFRDKVILVCLVCLLCVVLILIQVPR